MGSPVYKLLLCIRYLQTRYLAFICIVSVMLGVATLIVVNSVMSGFSTKLKDRLHGVLSDVVIDTERTDGFPEPPDVMMAKIKASPAGERIEALTPTIEAFAILHYNAGHPGGPLFTKVVRVIGVDPAGRTAVGGFKEYLHRQGNLQGPPSFDLTPEAVRRHDRNKRQIEQMHALELPPVPVPRPLVPPDPLGIAVVPNLLDGPFVAPPPLPDPAIITQGIEEPKLHGVIPGYNIAHFRFHTDKGEVKEETALHPGDSVTITTIGGADLKPVWGTFLVADYLKTEMSEYDQSFVYVPLEQLQKIRGMDDRCTAIQIKLKDYEKDKDFVTRELRKLFPYADFNIDTWEAKQGPLLAAIDVERGILNLLLFMIVGVAGFSILAIFTMIVSEKFRDIGILKSLGASSRGVMSIFLGYGLLLGTVGCASGTMLGLWITKNINQIEQGLTRLTGAAVFPRDVYYFKEIPTNVDLVNVALINFGAVAIAVVFSLLPAYRASRLHPVRALRFE